MKQLLVAKSDPAALTGRPGHPSLVGSGRRPHVIGFQMQNRDRLIELFRRRALKFGEFTLASGKKAGYYLDGKQITLHSEGLRLVSEGLLELLAGVEFQAIGGMSIGADPIIGGVLVAARATGRELVAFLVRKAAKRHGTQRNIEDPVQTGRKVG